MERKYSLLKRGGKAAAGGVVLGLALAIVRFGISRRPSAGKRRA